MSGATLPDEQQRTSVGHFPVESLGHRLDAIAVPVVLYRASTTNPRRTIDKWRRVAGGVPDGLVDVVVEGRHRGFDSIMGPGRVDQIGDDLITRLVR